VSATRGFLPSVALAAATAFTAADAAAQALPIRDNSFLIEEAYNQEAGVVQHAGLLLHAGAGSGWQFVFAQEWPLWSQRHQFSYSIPLAGGEGSTGLGDVGLNYRYQLLGGGDEPLALAPRLSLFLPTGDSDDGAGSGSVGVQVALPASMMIGRSLAGHLNLIAGLTPSSKNPAGATATAFDVAAGASVIWLAAPWVNFLVEGVWARADEVTGPGGTAGREEAFLNPGVRFAWNLPGGRQVVPGVAYTFGIGPSADAEPALLVYLSFEHPFGGRLTSPAAAAQFPRSPSRQAR
jgi:hypothetical protein